MFQAHIRTPHGEIAGIVDDNARALLERAQSEGVALLVIKIDKTVGHTVHMGIDWPFTLVLRGLPAQIAAWTVDGSSYAMAVGPGPHGPSGGQSGLIEPSRCDSSILKISAMGGKAAE